MANTPFYAFALVMAAVLLMAPGCALKDQEDNPIMPTDKFTQKALVVPKYLTDRADLLCKELDDAKPCYCVTCKNESKQANWLLGLFYDNKTLVGGTCGAYHCNQSDYIEIVNKSEDIEMRTFMLGSGQSFVSGGNAALFCNYTLQVATKWMVGRGNQPPIVPKVERAYCWLERDMLPLYIYYTEGGKRIDPVRTKEIARAFNSANVGPAILTTDAGWNGTDDGGAVGNVKAQIEALQSCTKCLKVLAVPPNGYPALYSIFGVPGGSIDYDMLSKVDAVGFGFRANDYPHCNIDTIIYENINLSEYILQKYNKPTIWLYVGASEGNSSIGNESTGGCEWDGAKVSKFYKELMGSTSYLANAGVLGMSLYEFVDRSGPIPCNGLQGCSFGMLNVSGGQKHPQLNSWSDMCQEVNARSEERTPLIFSRNGQGGTLCGEPLQNTQARAYGGEEIASDLGLSMDYLEPLEKRHDIGCGEACPGNTSMPSVYDRTGNDFGNKDNCTVYPQIDEYADDMDISATYFRAVIKQESGFDQFAISCVNESHSSCNPSKLTAAEICDMAGNPPGCKRDSCTEPINGVKQKPCAYGLAQCTEYPGENDDYTGNCGGENYNPFDPGMSACCGANKFGEYLRGAPDAAEKWVKLYWPNLAPPNCYGGMQDGEQGWAAYYLASNRYFGASWNRLTDFENQRPCTGGTGIYNHYIDYLRNNVTSSDPPGTSYGAQVMSRFRDAVRVCSSDCPK